MKKPKIIAIVGSTASGKTALGIQIARRFNGEVVSVDSRQVYRGMDIGTAKTKGDWGIDLVDPDEEYSAAEFKEYADRKIREIVERGHIPILVGGTGMWLKSVIDNLSLASTPMDPVLRESLESRPLSDLFHEYKHLDPEGAKVIDCENKRRVVRALEVTKLTHCPWSEMQTARESFYDVLQIGLSIPREQLNQRINVRVDEMVARGLIDEVRGLRERYGCSIKSMTGIGYRQVCEFLEGHTTIVEAIAEIKKATRQYAKRQMTWFKRDPRIQWADGLEQTQQAVEEFLKIKPTG